MQERQQALAESIELLTRDIHEPQRAREQDADHIRALVRIAEIHERRLSHLEGEES